MPIHVLLNSSGASAFRSNQAFGEALYRQSKKPGPKKVEQLQPWRNRTALMRASAPEGIFHQRIRKFSGQKKRPCGAFSPYSARKAFTGSTVAARREGK